MFPIRKLVVLCLGAALTMALVNPVRGAIEGGGEPRIDRFPGKVSYRSAVKIEGHVAGRAQGVQVFLQRRFAHNDWWKKIDTATTDRQGEVSFGLAGPRFTGRYRFRTSEIKGDPVLIRVRPDLGLRISRANVMEGSRVALEGKLRPAISGRRAKLSWRVDGQWHLIDNVRLGDGRFRKEVRVDSPGRRRIRITFARDPYNSWARSAEVLRVHRPSPATWYGPGFFGNRTACGRRYDRDLLGVAHRTLPCGTMVSALYKGRSVRVPVVDRGPYGHSQWDLTEETAQRLRFSGRSHIGVLIEQ